MSQPSRIYNASIVIDAKPRLTRLSCGLVNPQRKLIMELTAAGCVVTGCERISRTRIRICYDKRL